MPKIYQSQHCFYHPSQVYQLVNDIEQYPKFLPGCQNARILTVEPESLSAELSIVKGPIAFQFSTRNLLVENQSIEMQLIAGPFSHLLGKWLFLPAEPGCNVSLTLEFTMKNKLLEMTAGPLFQKLTHDMLTSFLKRAKEVYGTTIASH